jgi:membrane-associated phospholipid phosphatase
VPFLVLLAVSAAAGVAQALAASRIRFRRHHVPKPANVAERASSRVASLRRNVENWLAACGHPTVAAGLLLCLALAISVAGWLLLGVVALLVRTNDALLEIDSTVAQWGSDHATDSSTRALGLITMLGDTRVVLGLAGLLLIVEWLRDRRRVALFLVAAIGGNVLATALVKDLFDRARPELNPLAETLGPSFPSGHSSTAAVFYAAAAVLLARRRRHWVFTAATSVAVALGVAVAGSRVLLDVHWLSDVVAGLALGWAWLAFCVVGLYADPATLDGFGPDPRVGSAHSSGALRP